MPAMPPRLIQALLMGVLTCAPCAAQSQASPGQFTLYRCGSQGRELRNTPCPQELGASQVMRDATGDARAAEAARERSRGEGRLADRLRHEREARASAEQEALKQASQGVVIKAAAASAATPPPSQAPVQRTTKPRRGKPAHKSVQRSPSPTPPKGP